MLALESFSFNDCNILHPSFSPPKHRTNWESHRDQKYGNQNVSFITDKLEKGP